MVISAEYPHAFRRQFPRKRAIANRLERRKVRQQLNGLAAPEHQEERDIMPLRPVRRPIVRKWSYSAVPLKEWIKDRHEFRASRTAWNFFKQPYDSQYHRQRFANFLQTLTSNHNKSPHTTTVAKTFQLVLNAPERSVWRNNILHIDRRYTWLQAFFKDEPLWEARLRDWIAIYKLE